jgi:hypothetical protein
MSQRYLKNDINLRNHQQQKEKTTWEGQRAFV